MSQTLIAVISNYAWFNYLLIKGTKAVDSGWSCNSFTLHLHVCDSNYVWGDLVNDLKHLSANQTVFWVTSEHIHSFNPVTCYHTVHAGNNYISRSANVMVSRWLLQSNIFLNFFEVAPNLPQHDLMIKNKKKTSSTCYLWWWEFRLFVGSSFSSQMALHFVLLLAFIISNILY